jgi:hypothetical protein
MEDILQIWALWLAAILWGGLLTVDFLVTPARAATPNVEDKAKTAIGGQIFRYMGLGQLVLGLGLLVVLPLMGAGAAAILTTLFILALTGLQVALIEPRLSKSEDEAFRQWHQAYMAADVFKAILGAILLAVLVSL